jgi:hypothetical protein
MGRHVSSRDPVPREVLKRFDVEASATGSFARTLMLRLSSERPECFRDDPGAAQAGAATGVDAIPAKWASNTPRDAITCSEGVLVVENAIIDVAEDAILATGSCQIRLKGSFVRGSRAAVIRDQARISASDSRMQGRAGAAVRVESNSALFIAKRTEIAGPIDGHWKDNGGNTLD